MAMDRRDDHDAPASPAADDERDRPIRNPAPANAFDGDDDGFRSRRRRKTPSRRSQRLEDES